MMRPIKLQPEEAFAVLNRTIFVALACAAVLSAGGPAEARQCKSFGFAVNDYGKEGPTRDALALLDVHIKKQMDERGVKKYTVGKKSVSCKLFLDFIVFDEWTCTAVADACWGLGPVTTRVDGEPTSGPAKSR
ncbi:MAG: hypothetical protein NW215_02975 [Hyphomicrobiales bacterium]|nr:hypothetical protein [Hyphomicrobiales bacterium]